MEDVPQIHGHEILRLVHGSESSWTRADLTQEAQRRFGPGVRYCTCSTQGMTLDELLSFLLMRGKLVEHQGRISADISKMCQDGEHSHDHD